MPEMSERVGWRWLLQTNSGLAAKQFFVVFLELNGFTTEIVPEGIKLKTNPLTLLVLETERVVEKMRKAGMKIEDL